MIPATDLQAQALERLAFQYRDSPNFQAVIGLLTDEAEEALTAIRTLEALRLVDTSEGDGLDGIGQIVGQPRELAGVVPVDYFAYHDGAGGPASEGFGDLTDASAGLRYRGINESPTVNKLLGDAEYRRFIEAKIARNRSEATPEEIISAIQAVLPDDPPIAVHLTFAPTAVTATVQRVLSAEELQILNAVAGIRGTVPVIPRAVGVSLTVAGL